MNERVALIVGAGPGISAAFGNALVADGYQVALASRDVAKLSPLAMKMSACAVMQSRSDWRMSAEETRS
jgi:NADP-dependent 3-hydroxy acid dehydrogenase YdfG